MPAPPTMREALVSYGQALGRTHVAVSKYLMKAAYSCETCGRITQLQYLSHLTRRTFENSVNANFAETDLRSATRSPTSSKVLRLLLFCLHQVPQG